STTGTKENASRRPDYSSARTDSFLCLLCLFVAKIHRVSRMTARLRLSPFWLSLGLLAALYLAFLLALLGAMATYTSPHHLWEALQTREIRYSVGLSIVTCTASALLALLLAVPVGYLLARGSFPGKPVLDALLDIPIVLPPMVVGLCLLIFFQTPAGKLI